MAFTTWAALETQMLNDLASGSWRRESYSMDDMNVRYRSFEDFKAALDYVRHQAAIETGSATGRTKAKPIGGPFV